MWRESLFFPGWHCNQGGQCELRGYRQIPCGWVNRNISQLGQGNEVWDETLLQTRLVDPYSTTSIETQMLSEKLFNFQKKHGVPREALVMDAGCADGRITRLLLDVGMEHIVSTDLNLENVNRLISRLNDRERERVLAIVDDFNHLPIADEKVDVIIASGLLAEMPDLEEALQSTMRMLKKGGLLFYVDPILEHALLYALIRNDLEEFLRVVRTGTRARMWDEKEHRYRVYFSRELERKLCHPHLEILEKDGISIFPSLVFGGVFQEKPSGLEMKKDLKEELQRLSEQDIPLFRQIILIGRKRS
jgi:SAM-dependent methyltransferase